MKMNMKSYSILLSVFLLACTMGCKGETEYPDVILMT